MMYGAHPIKLTWTEATNIATFAMEAGANIPHFPYSLTVPGEAVVAMWAENIIEHEVTGYNEPDSEVEFSFEGLNYIWEDE